MQADHGRFDRQNHQMNMYKGMLCAISRDLNPTPEFINSIVDCHIDLGDMSKESAVYQVLQIAAGLKNYGVEFHDSLSDSDVTQVGVGPQGVTMYNSSKDIVER